MTIRHSAMLIIPYGRFAREEHTNMAYRGSHEIAHGDVLTVLKGLPSSSFDGLLCDPPYGISFMGKKWDYNIPSVDVWREALRVLKPGAPLLSFGGTRTFHRVTCNIEDAGFQIKDVLSWLYGSGFPKGVDVSKAIDRDAGASREAIGEPFNGRIVEKSAGFAFKAVGKPRYQNTAPATDLAKQWAGYNTALKPSWEPCVFACKPREGTVLANVKAYGVGGIAIDACRILDTSKGAATDDAMRIMSSNAVGRWPANVCLDEYASAALDESTGVQVGEGPSRFFYTSKVSKFEREYGVTSNSEESDSSYGPIPGRILPKKPARNNHPTLKPIALTNWLAKLILPPGKAKLLVPFSGAGSEMIGALQAGWSRVFGIEAEQKYVELAHERILAWACKP